MSKTIYGVIAGLAVLVLLGLGAAFYLNQESDTNDSQTPATETNESSSAEQSQQTSEPEANQEETATEDEQQSSQIVRVNYTDDGFDPEEVTISLGDTVTWTNNSSRDMWVASDVHPTHEVYPAFDSNQGVASGETYSFTFDEEGAWQYHDHLRSSQTGKVTVTN